MSSITSTYASEYEDCRWQLIVALHADDPVETTQYLAACQALEPSQLVPEAKTPIPLHPTNTNESSQLTTSSLLHQPANINAGAADFCQLVEMDQCLCELLNNINPVPCQTFHHLAILVLAVASQFGCSQVVPQLLSIIKDEYIFDDGRAIIKACEHGRVDVAETLLGDKRIDPSSADGQALWLACRNGHIGIVKLLLEDARMDFLNFNNAALEAMKNDHIDILKLLLYFERASPWTTLLDAGRHGFLQVVKMMLEDVRTLSAANESLCYACSNGHIEVVKLFLSDERVDPSVMQSETVRLASVHGNLEMVKLLMQDQRIDASGGGEQFPLCDASEYGHVSVMTQLLTDPRVQITKSLLADADLNEPTDDKSPSTPESRSVGYMALLRAVPRFWPALIDDVNTESVRGGAMRGALDRIEANSSFVLLLCVKRRFEVVVAARLSDVLREVCTAWTNFQTKEVVGS